MISTIDAARYLVQLLDDPTRKYDSEYEDTLKLANKLTAEKQALDELHSSAQVLIRYMMDEALHEVTMQAAERVNVALRRVKIT
jgi:hypothetical protein